MNKYRALVTDLDGTLLTTDKKITEENKKALMEARKSGCKIVLCSGRSPKSMQQYVDFLGFRDEGEYYLGNHGGVIVESSTDCVVEAYTIQDRYLKWFVEIGRKYSNMLNVHFYKDDYFMVERRVNSTKMYEKMTSMKAGVLVPDLLEVVNDDIQKALFIGEQPGYVLEVKEELEKQNMPEGMQLVASSPYLLEYADEMVDKGYAVKKLMGHMGIDMADVICVGDSFNDISMLRVAGMGVAVCNAEKEVKSVAGYVTESTNDEDAIVEIVNKFIIKSPK